MKVKLETIINAQQAFSELAKQPMSIKASYRIASLLKAIQRELDIYNEQRIKIFVDIGCPLSEDGKQYLVPQNKKLSLVRNIRSLWRSRSIYLKDLICQMRK